MLPGACIIHFPKCKTVVLDYEVLGGRNGKERWYLSILLSSKIKKYTSLTLMSNKIKTRKEDKKVVLFYRNKGRHDPITSSYLSLA